MEETSKKVRHTPGPWRVKHFTVSNHRYSYKINADAEQETDEEAEANARLLASAPSLLEALEELYSFTPDIDKLADTSTDFGKGLADAINKAKAAIKLAKGNGES